MDSYTVMRIKITHNNQDEPHKSNVELKKSVGKEYVLFDLIHIYYNHM